MGRKSPSVIEILRWPTSEHFLVEAESVCRDLMFNMLPDVNLEQIKDDLTNKGRSFSFVNHPRNRLSYAYLELSTRAYTARRNGLFDGKKGRWNWEAVFRYLKEKERQVEMIASVLHTTVGQVARAVEMFTLECENGPATERGLYVCNECIVTLTRHHKAKRSTNREVFVVRYLPARADRILYYYLPYIRPFVDMLERENRSHHMSVDPKSKSTLLFRSDQMPCRPWNPARLTAILKTATSRVWGWPVTAQLYRQPSIAIPEKHVQEVHKHFNRHDDKGIRS
jgi:hypothetical protein